MRRRLPLFLALTAGCAGVVGSGDQDAGVDAGPTDAGVPSRDSGSADAGVIDAGAAADAGTDAGIDAGQSKNDAGIDAGCRGVFCDDFEGHTLGADPKAPWTVTTWQNDSTAKVDGTQAHSGSKSIKFSVTAGAGKSAMMLLKNAPVFPIAGNVLFGRMWIWLTQGAPDGVHWTNIHAEGPVAGKTFRGMYRYGGMNLQKFLANYETAGAATDCWRESVTRVPEGRWACIEWRFAGPTNEMDLWVDGAAINDITVINKGDGCIGHETNDVWMAPTFDTLKFGWEHYQSSTIPISMWIDDVAVGTTRQGCQ
jgi:hypothetical protein